jgi:hypothetical protein
VFLRPTYPPPPLQVPIRLDQKGVVADFNFEITEDWHYVFYIRFAFPEKDQVERARVRKIIAGTDFDPGILTPVKLSIFRKEQGFWVLLHEKEITPTLTSWGGDNFKKTVEGRKLVVGEYRAMLESFAEPVEYATIPTKFGIGMFKYGK